MLNVGSGDRPVEGAVNIDFRPDAADVVGDAARLPFPDGCADEIVAHDILEHFPRSRTASVLGEWRRVCRPGGYLRVRVPNLTQLCRWIVEDYHPELAIRNIYGGQQWGPDGMWDSHFWGWTPRTLDALLREEGWKPVSNDLALNMEVTAERG